MYYVCTMYMILWWKDRLKKKSLLKLLFFHIKKEKYLFLSIRLLLDYRVSHEFFMNLSPQNPYCDGIDGVISAYYQSINSVRLYGPTNFSPVIRYLYTYMV